MKNVYRTKVEEVFEYCRIYDNNKNIRLDKIREFLKRESDITYITEFENRKISDRFVDKIIDVTSRYETGDLNMLFKCTSLVLYDMASKNGLNTKTTK